MSETVPELDVMACQPVNEALEARKGACGFRLDVAPGTEVKILISGGVTHAVGTNLANELGLFDLSGNAWEWCFDVYSGMFRVVRGGTGDYGCRVAYRGSYSLPEYQSNPLGFRVVRSADP